MITFALMLVYFVLNGDPNFVKKPFVAEENKLNNVCTKAHFRSADIVNSKYFVVTKK